MDVATQERCAGEVQAALEELRTAVQRPLGRTARTTATTLRDELTHLQAAAAAEPGGPTVVVEDPDGTLDALPAHAEAPAQSVLNEAVRNARKHARPTRIEVHVLAGDDAFVIEVVNDGVPEAGGGRTVARRGGPSTGMGLRLAAFEALQVGGVVEFGRRDGGRWTVRLVVPRDV